MLAILGRGGLVVFSLWFCAMYVLLSARLATAGVRLVRVDDQDIFCPTFNCVLEIMPVPTRSNFSGFAWHLLADLPHRSNQLLKYFALVLERIESLPLLRVHASWIRNHGLTWQRTAAAARWSTAIRLGYGCRGLAIRRQSAGGRFLMLACKGHPLRREKFLCQQVGKQSRRVSLCRLVVDCA